MVFASAAHIMCMTSESTYNQSASNERGVFSPPLRRHTVEYKQRRSRGPLRLHPHPCAQLPVWLRQLGEAATVNALASVIVDVIKFVALLVWQNFMR